MMVSDSDPNADAVDLARPLVLAERAAERVLANDEIEVDADLAAGHAKLEVNRVSSHAPG